jgi:transcriptional regulator GlxA family with amidase domain
MTADKPAQTIAVIAFDGISPFHLSVSCMVFGPDMAGHGVPRYRLLVCSLDRGSLRTTAGFAIEAPYSLAAAARADTIIVPSWHDDQRPVPEALLRTLRSAHKRGARIVGLCLGAFVLAEAGLLDGQPATTHWALARAFGERYPTVDLRPDVLYVDNGQVLTSAGTAASIDCCLHMVRRDHGADVAAHVARRMVVAPHREGGQAQYIEQPVPASRADDRMGGVMAWALKHLAQPHSLNSLADRAAMSRRTFTRHFRQATGTTVGQWLQQQRLTMARRLLETTTRSIDDVAERSGFGSAVSLRQHFASALGTSPSAYRRQFRGA